MASKPIRVLLITRNLPPLRGGMERLNRHMAIELAKAFRVSVIGPRGAREFLPAEMTVQEVNARALWKFFIGALWHSVRMARRESPDIVLGGSGLVAPFVWLAAKMTRARMALYVHGLDLIARHPVYRAFWIPLIRRADLCIANSRHTAGLAEKIGMPAERIAIVHPGVELPSAQLLDVPNDFRMRFEIGDRPMLLSVGRLIARKGLLEFVENALPKIAARFPEVRLVILGDELPNLLQGDSTGLGERIRQRAAELGVADNLCFIGPQSDAVLADAWRAADAHVFPVREVPGDVEGFGMVAVEAAAHGLPTVAFAVGGVPDAVCDGVSGHLVPAGDYERMAAKIIELVRFREKVNLRGGARIFSEKFSWNNFEKKIRFQIISMLGFLHERHE